MNTKQEQERAELHRAIWAIADELRGSVSGWDFKCYVLGAMFYRYISENFTAYVNEGERESGAEDFDYASMADEDISEEARLELIQEKGFFIYPSELFCNVMKKAASDKDLNMTLEKIFTNITNSSLEQHDEPDAEGRPGKNRAAEAFEGLFDDFNTNSPQLGPTVQKRNERLVKLLNGVSAMKLGSVKHNETDAFGDAYEYLMGMYASNAGKAGGEFYSPAKISQLLSRLSTEHLFDSERKLRRKVNKVYDPACGSGSLLLKAQEILGKDGVEHGFYGQEINLTTYNLCRINMHLHDVPFNKFNIKCEDTLTHPCHWDDEPFEMIVTNMPYSISWAGSSDPLLINDPRFAPAGVLAPKSKADLAFVMHCLAWLAPNGVASLVCFPGVMYRGGAEQKIRKYLVENNFIDCIIQMSAGLFFGTGVSVVLMVLKKNKQDNKVLFIDASREYVKASVNNLLSDDNIEHIVKAFMDRKDVPHFARLVHSDEIKEQDFNLSVSTYVEPEDTREKVDIRELNAKIKQIVAREQELRNEIDRIIEEIEGEQADLPAPQE